MTATTLLYCWLLCSPLGYLSCRWATRKMGDSWTKVDRLFVIIGSVFYGPLLPIVAASMVILHKLFSSEWGKKEARW